jgi:hypothetical protein
MSSRQVAQKIDWKNTEIVQNHEFWLLTLANNQLKKIRGVSEMLTPLTKRKDLGSCLPFGMGLIGSTP